MKALFPLLSVFFLLSSCREKAPDEIIIGKQDKLFSKILNEERRIWIHLPGSFHSSAPVKQKYPVIYLLDGNSHFHSVTGLLEQLTANGLVPEMIVVGIPNTDRSRDLTPTNSLKLPDGNEREFLKTTGGAEHFTQFLEKELIPHIESTYPTLPHRVLIGHSFGGLFAINALLKHPELFDSYVSIDPSMWWDDRKLLEEADSILSADQFKGKSLFLAVANTMPFGMDTLVVGRDTTSTTTHIRSILSLASKVRSASSTQLNFGWKYYRDDDHGTVPLIAEYDAFRFLFNFYRLPSDNPSYERIKQHYATVSERLNYPIIPPEQLVNNAGYVLMERKELDEAEKLFQLNIGNYPESQNVYDSMGDLYVEKGDTARAIEFFTKALEIGEVEATRAKLEKLKSNKEAEGS